MPVSLLKPGSATKPLPGVDADVVDENGKPVEQGRVGLLVIKKPWPAMFRNIYNDPELYKETYWSRFPGMYLAGDAARKDLDGCIWILGRADEALPLFFRALRIRSNDADVMNSIARIRAAWPDAKLRNAAEAVRIAERACQLSARKNAGYLDTLAIAYAAAGRFADAVKVAEEALAIAPGNSPLGAAIRRHLELFKAGKPFIGR